MTIKNEENNKTELENEELSSIVGGITGEETKTDDELSSIKAKYKDNIDEIARALKEQNAFTAKVVNDMKPPKEYKISSEHASLLTKKQIDEMTDLARLGEFGQKQFDALAIKIVNATKLAAKKTIESAKTSPTNPSNQSKEKYKVNDKFNIDELRAYYRGKYDEDVLEDILTSGSERTLQRLTDQRSNELRSANSPGFKGAEKGDKKEKSLKELYEEHKKLTKERLLPQTDSEKREELEKKGIELSKQMQKIIARTRIKEEDEMRKEYLS